MAEARERASEQRGAAWRTAAENLEQVKVAAQVRRAVHEPACLPYLAVQYGSVVAYMNGGVHLYRY